MIEILGEVPCNLTDDLTRVFDEVSRVLRLPKKVKVNLTFVSEEEIQKLNRETRNIDRITDVLSYPYTNLKPYEKLKLCDYATYFDPFDKTLTIGDIYICTVRACEQAKEFGHGLKREICFLFCHGLLHICGFDHIEQDDEKIMFEMQNKILNNLSITRDKPFKAGFVTILGETNAGKSTLINALVNEHVAIVSPKTQTTRENIQGIYNDDNCQIVFVDTPGYHRCNTLIDEEMDKQIEFAQQDTEIVLMLIVANKPIISQYEKLSKCVHSKAKKILVINKIDEVKYEKLYPELQQLSIRAEVDEILPISALKQTNIQILLDMVKKYLPTYNKEIRYYPIDEYTDKNMRHIVAEIIREKALLCLDDEVPHGVQVIVTKYSENATPIDIEADLFCEKESHKAIILGKSGEMIKKISTLARKSIEYYLSEHINLRVFVKVKANWRNDSKAIEEFGLLASE